MFFDKLLGRAGFFCLKMGAFWETDLFPVEPGGFNTFFCTLVQVHDLCVGLLESEVDILLDLGLDKFVDGLGNGFDEPIRRRRLRIGSVWP